MKVRELRDPVEFQSLVEPLTVGNEARNSLFLGITGTLIDRPEAYEDFRLWVVFEDGTPIAAAAMTPPHNLLLADGASRKAIGALAQFLDDHETDLPGVQGNLPAVEYFCEAWQGMSDLEPVLEVELGVHVLTEVAEIPDARGTARVASLEDKDLLVEWVTAFLIEADPLSPRSNIDEAMEKRLGVQPGLGGTWLWEVDGEPVALSGYGGRTPSGIRIGPVYTPPALRNRGYATALVAAQSAWLLEQGRRFCFLFTDMANPTSNSIYRRIGYEKVGDARRYGFPGRGEPA